jgi:calcium permeable stress-gated cation channel
MAYQYVFQTSFNPLKNSLPLSLAHLSYGMPKGKDHADSFVEAEASEASYYANADPGMPGKGADRVYAWTSSDVETTGGDSAAGLTETERNGDVEMAHLDGQVVEVADGVAAQDFAPNAPRHLDHHQQNEAEKRQAEETLDSDAFSHPATKEPQRVIWLPEDALGLAAAEVRDNEYIGISSTYQDATLDRKVSHQIPRVFRLL